jgi:cytoskeletal protein CcmA (bactofilin family)
MTPENSGNEPKPQAERAHIGRSVVIKGELDGSEDLIIEGQVEGKIELREHTLTIGANGRIKAQVFAKSVVVLGELVGNINAAEKVEIRENGAVDGDIVAPRIAIAEGAHFRGSIDMQRKGQPPKAGSPVESRLPAIPTLPAVMTPRAGA